MSQRTGLQVRPRRTHRKPPRRRHWLRWITGSVVLLLALGYVAVWAFIKLQPVPAPLGLPVGHVSAPAGPLEGRWDVAAGSVAGFRVQETALGFRNDATGRTNAVSGAVVISGGKIVTAAFDVGLGALKVNGKPSPQVAASLQTRRHPYAVVRLNGPVQLPSAFASGAAVSLPVAGQLTLNGVTHPVRFTVSVRRDGRIVEATGQIPVAFATWGIKQPTGFGLLGSLASHGVAEFLLIMHQT